jgi:hypothetical protein
MFGLLALLNGKVAMSIIGIRVNHQTIAEILIPCVTMPVDNALTVATRRLADSVEGCVKKVRNHTRHPTCSVMFLFTSAYNNAG